MITNSKITYYSKSSDENKIGVYSRILFEDVWVFSGLGGNIDRGLVDANSVIVRIPMEYVENKDIFKVGDLVAIGIGPDIEKQADLIGLKFFKVTSVNVNDFGHNPHIHLIGS